MIIGIANRKGGVGKTSCAVNIAAELQARGCRVRVFDCDPQRSLMIWAGLGDGVLASLAEPLDASRATHFLLTVKAATTLFDHVVIDTPASHREPALLTALVADTLLLPTGPSILDLMGAKDVLELAITAYRDRNSGKPRVFFIPCRTNPSTTLSRNLPASLAALRNAVLPAIAQRNDVVVATERGLSVREHRPRSKAALEFSRLTDELERLA